MSELRSDNPFGSPQTKSRATRPRRVDLVEWYANPVLRGVIAGGVAGGTLNAICSIMWVPYLQRLHWPELSWEAMFIIAVGAAAGGTTGGVTGNIVGAVAYMTRRSRRRTTWQFLVCAVGCPAFFVGTYYLLITIHGDPPPRESELVCVIFVIGIATAIYMLDGLLRLAKKLDASTPSLDEAP